MPKFMNSELEHIRDNLVCGHCEVTFKGSDSQAWKVKYEGRAVYCSKACRHAALRNKFSTPVPNRGPCGTCGKEFFSRTAKLFCGLDCYLKSDRFKEVQAEASRAAARLGLPPDLSSGPVDCTCAECGEQFQAKRSARRKFCSKICYRSYLAKRFDRWIANPEGLALPQCYDEFLDQNELSCVVDGCNWTGQGLTAHVNLCHGVPRDEFKRAAGFNLSTGVIARPLAQTLRAREKHGIAVARAARSEQEGFTVKRGTYVSAESREHAKKSRALAPTGPERLCCGCGAKFRQSTPFGRARYCTVECRNAHYAAERHATAKVRTRDAQGKFVWVPSHD